MTPRIRRIGALIVALALPIACAQAADPPSEGEVLAAARKEIASLDDDHFGVRDRAAEQLDALVADPRNGALLAPEFSRVLLSGQSSVEVSSRLDLLVRRLPAPQPAGDEPSSPEAIGPLLDQLYSNASTQRDAAERKLRRLLAQDSFIGPVMTELKLRLGDASIRAERRKILEPLLDKARESWVLSKGEIVLPEVSRGEMTRWIDDYLQSGELDTPRHQRQVTADRELRDLTVRDDTRPAVLKLLEARIAVADDAGAAALRELVDFSRPAMAAEVWGHQMENIEHRQHADWEHRQHITVQHLLIGVPQMPETALRPTHFDRIDDKTAHCVSGNALSEGDYPVGVAVPNPLPSYELIYYLSNLPTPRRRLAYEFRLKRDEHERLLEITKNTLADFLDNKRVLNELQILMLAQLDPRTVSRWVGKYLQAVPNQPLGGATNELAGQQTLHGGICYMMSRIGTHEAVPALEQAARSGQLGAATYDNPFQIAWIAALAIAQRNSWPDSDEWLGRLIGEKTPLVSHLDIASPDLGASAAAILLERHGQSIRSFGIEPTGETALERLRFVGHRFTSEKNREQTQRWWRKLSAKAAEASP